MNVVQIPLDRIDDNPWQTRLGYDPEHIRQIALSILRNGLQQAPSGRLAWETDDGLAPRPVARDVLQSQEGIDELLEDSMSEGIQLAFGHNRRRAFKRIAEWVEKGVRPARPEEEAAAKRIPIEEDDLPEDVVPGRVPVRLRQYDDELMADLAWSENYDREDLSPLEEARAIEQRMEDFDLTQTEVAERLGMARSTVSNKLRLLRLPEWVVDAVEDDFLSERAASALVPYFDLTEEQRELVSGWNLDQVLTDIRQRRDEVTSGRARSATEELGNQASLSTFPFDLDHNLVGDRRVDLEPDEVQHGTCEGCPVAYEYDGEMQCPDRTCRDNKKSAWGVFRAQQVADEVGVELVGNLRYHEGTNFRDMSGMHEHDVQALEIARDERCDNLVLSLRDYGFQGDLRPEGAPQGAVWACQYGEDGRCECRQRLKEDAEQEANREQERIDRLKGHVESQVQEALDELTTTQLCLAAGGKAENALDEDTGTLRREVLLEDVADNVTLQAGQSIDWNERDQFEPWVEAFESHFELIGLDVDVEDPQTPRPANELEALVEAAITKGDDAAPRSLQQLRFDVDRRREYVETYLPEEEELEQLEDLEERIVAAHEARQADADAAVA